MKYYSLAVGRAFSYSHFSKSSWSYPNFRLDVFVSEDNRTNRASFRAVVRKKKMYEF